MIKVKFSKNLEVIDTFTFNCNNLKSINIPNNVNNIGIMAFSNNQLQEIVIPESVRYIAPFSFRYNHLTSVTVENEDTIIKWGAFIDQKFGSELIDYWYKNKNYEGDAITDIAANKRSGSTTYYAYYTVDVNFEENGGLPVIDDIKDQNAHTLISTPNTPTKELRDFAGWYTDDQTFVNKWDFDNDRLTKDITLYAKWTIKKFPIKFESNGGSEVDELKVEYDTLIKEPITPTREGYDFTGWYKEPDLISKWNFKKDTVPLEGTTLYAGWSIKEYSVIFEDYDGTRLDTQTLTHGSSAKSPEIPTRNGYKFTNWSHGFSEITSDLIIKAEYRKIRNTSNKQSKKGISVIINGKKQTLGLEDLKVENGKRVVKLNLYNYLVKQKIQEVLNENKASEIIRENILEIVVNSKNTDIIYTTLTNDVIKEMNENQFTFAIKAKGVDYVIPMQEFNLEDISKKLSSRDSFKDIDLEVRIEKANKNMLEKVQAISEENNIIIIPPIDFTIKAKTKSDSGEVKSLTISKFSQFVERIIEIPHDLDPDTITTGVIYNSDGLLSHVPTVIYEEDEVSYAKIRSLTNSKYTLISNDIEVAAVEDHWAKESVNDMAGRLIIENTETFNPDKNITRGAFAEYITKAIGIYRTDKEILHSYWDVDIDNKYSKAISKASEYGIISGYPDGSFRPEKNISRQEAMAMLANVMRVINFIEEDALQIEKFQDKDKISSWAYQSEKKVVDAKIIRGKTNNTMMPLEAITYSEAATAIRNLLFKAELIDY